TVLGKTVTRKAAERIGKPTTKTPATGKSIKGGRDVQPTLVGDQQAGVLGSWTNLGPGNVGGRTRALIINPNDANIMYAAGVAGGIWKSTDAGASWTPLDDFMPNIAVTTLAFDPDNPDTIWAGTGEGYFNGDAVRGAGIFRSTNAGANWFRLPATNNADFHYVQKLVVSPANSNNIYAATRTGLMRSINNGASWTRVLSSAASGCTAPCVNTNTFGGGMDVVMRTDQATDYIFVSMGTGFDPSFPQARIYRNTDAGGAGLWTEVYTEANMARTSLAIAPSNQNVIYALASSRANDNYNTGLLAVLRSTTSGDAGSWTTQVRNTSANKQDTLLLTNPVIAALSDCGFAPAGSNQFFNQGWYDNQIAVDPANSDVVWSAGIDLFRSDNGGVNWGVASYWWFTIEGTPPANRDSNEFVHADNHVFAFKPGYNGTTNQTMYVGNDGGMFRTDNARSGNVGVQAGAITPASAVCGNPVTGAVQWTAINNGYQVSQFYHGMPFPDGSNYLGGFQDNGTNRGSDAAGPNGWSRILGGDGGYVAVDPTNTNILYAENTGLSFQKSTNGGVPNPDGTSSFFDATSGITGDDFDFIAPFYMDTTNPLRLYIGGFYVWRTNDGAASWQRTGGFTPGNGFTSALASAPSNPDALIVGMTDGFIGRLQGNATTSPNTTAWSSVQPRTGAVSWVTFDPTNANIAYATYSTFNSPGSVGHIWKSTNGGLNWSRIDGTGVRAFPDIPAHVIVVDPTNTQRLYVGSDLGVFVSLDGGATWNKEVTGFANVQTESMAIATSGGKSSLFAFTHGRSAYRVTLSASCVTSVLPTTPPSFNKDGGTGTITVTSAVPTCDWTSATNDGFIQITAGRTGAGTGTVTFTVAPNATSAARTGTINVAGRVVTITQDAQPAASASITGQVVDGTGQPVSAATVNLTGTVVAATVTNSAGGYSFNNLTPGGNYTVTVAKSGLTFGTPSKTINNLLAVGVANFAGYVTPPAVPAEQGRLIISEFRLRGVSSASDEFIEFYNNSDSPLTITTTDGSEGWAVTGSDGNMRFVIPVNQTIPARGHYLAINTAGYTLSNYGGTSAAAGDATYTAEFPDDSGITLFTTAKPANYSESTRMDAVGFTSEANVLAREGVGLAPLANVGGQYSFVRKLTTGTPLDTANNRNDFVLVSTTGGTINGVQSVLGAPGPENVLSQLNRTNVVKSQLIDPQCSGFGTPASACQRVRTANGANPTNAAFGTLLIRRRFTNTTQQSVSRLRFRVVDLTTLGNAAAGEADLRVLDSTGGTLTLVNGSTSTLTPLTLDTTPAQPGGGGLNSTLNLATPIISGAFVDIEFKLGVMTNGAYRFFIVVEALP
ncbi:MAG TPA: carboxypeptidase regulatory-like domain-containing protein, partial [Pyrinomonadaceae bacterium]|nr:carboxypeptidase regulatory-like domain-containing protein [Pyrinomonadaceae bacterium]